MTTLIYSTQSRNCPLLHPVFPVWGCSERGCDCGHKDCDSRGKHPVGSLAPNGCLSATVDSPMICHWFEECPSANIGIRTGDVSEMFVVDIDRGKGAGDGFEHLKHLDPEGLGWDGIETVKSRTGSGGGHLFFAQPADLHVKNAVKVQGTAIDVRGNGGYVIVPPSQNGAGPYQWEAAPDEVELSDCPRWLLDFILGRFSPEIPGNATFTYEGTLQDHPGASKGERNDVGCRLIGAYLAEHGLTNDLQPLAVEWGSRCTPALAESEVHRMVAGLAKKHLASSPTSSKANPKTKPALITMRSADVEEEELVWLWFNRFLTGHINILAGDPGLGKSLLAVDAAARVSTGRSWPDGSPCQRGKVIYCTTEDAFSSVVKPRLSAAHADHSQVIFVAGVQHADGDEGAMFLDEHIRLLDAELQRHKGEVRLLILDTLQSYVSSDTNTNNNASSRRIMTPLKRLAERHQVAVLCNEHLTKGSRPGSSTYRVQGSIAFTGAARAVWIVVADPDDKSRRIVQASKTNLAPDNEGLGLSYHIEGEVGRPFIVWGETNIDTPLSDLMDDSGRGAGGDDAKSQFAAAVELLQDNLMEPTPAAEMQELFKAEGISKTTMKRARDHLGVKTRRVADGWMWIPGPKVTIGSEVIANPMQPDDPQETKVPFSPAWHLGTLH